MFWNIPEAYKRTILVVLRNNCVTWWSVLQSTMVRMSALLSSVEIAWGWYFQQQLLITKEFLIPHKFSDLIVENYVSSLVFI